MIIVVELLLMLNILEIINISEHRPQQIIANDTFQSETKHHEPCPAMSTQVFANIMTRTVFYAGQLGFFYFQNRQKILGKCH